MTPEIRSYDHERDLEDVTRIWREVGWIEDNESHRASLAAYLTGDGADAEVGILDGRAECLVHRTTGTLTCQSTPLPLCAITGVTTSHVGRKLGFASTMTARALRSGAETGAAISALGAFEQGFYDRFGFATASYSHVITFDPQTLKLDHVAYRTPVRLTADDSADMAAALAGRHLHHGATVLDPPTLPGAELGWAENSLALGYRDGDGTLTHFFAGDLKGEHGPFRISMMAYRSIADLLELLKLLQTLGDQIHAVKLDEPAELDLQVLLSEPVRQRNRSRRSDLESVNIAVAWWQLRILDVEATVAARRWHGPAVRFDLDLSDPVADFLDPLDGWAGSGGAYTVELGTTSSATRGHRGGLPLVTCDVGAFTRLWFGIAPASTLWATDRFDAPDDLCSLLDESLLSPPTLPGLEY